MEKVASVPRNVRRRSETPRCITNVSIRDFKALENVDVKASWLTVLVGANSAGKSSLIQSLLMLAQSLEDAEPGYVNLNSEVLQLGTAAEVMRRSKPGKDQAEKSATSLEIGVTFDSPSSQENDIESVSNSIKFLLLPEGKAKGANQIRLELEKYSSVTSSGQFRSMRNLENVKLKLSRAISKQTKYLVYHAIYKEFENDENHVRSRSLQSRFSEARPSFVVARSQNRNRLGTVPTGALVVGDLTDLINSKLRFMPYYGPESGSSKAGGTKSLSSLISEFGEYVMTQYVPIQVDSKEIHFPAQSRTIFLNSDMRILLSQIIHLIGHENRLPTLDRGALKDTKFSRHEFAYEENQYLEMSGSEYLATKIRYLGPLREREHSPGLALSFQRNNIIPLGVKGEKMADYLLRKQNDEAFYPRIDGSKHKTTLKLAINHWLETLFGFEETLEVADEGIGGPVARLGSTRFQHLGTGISQLMPVIVLSLSAPQGTTVIFEQPELHLHPAMQQKLADFFVHMARAKRQIILETQSEYILTRIRRHLSDGALKPQETAVLFATRGEIASREIQSDGTLDSEWPEDFFDFALDDTIALMDATTQL